MEQTIGRRIAENRKRLGMTQDQLAEKLGVTAQAVSKWENDQSCPDITMLPRLAEIFGISTDALLGRDTAQPVHTAEVIDEEENEPEGLHIDNGNWEFHWDAGRKGSVLFAVFVLLVGALTLVARMLSWDVSFWNILWPTALLVWGLDGVLRKFSFFGIGCTLFGAYFLLENLGITQLNLAGELIFPVLIVIFGLSLLADALRKPKKHRFSVNTGSKDEPKAKSSFRVDEDRFHCGLSFGEAERYIAVKELVYGDVQCSFGELVVDLSGCEKVAPGCAIEGSCSFGEVLLKVPSKFRVEPYSSTAFASIEFDGQPNAEPQGVIQLKTSVSFGEVTVEYI